MGSLIFGAVLLVIGLVVRATGKSGGSKNGKAAGFAIRMVAMLLMLSGVLSLAGSSVKVIDAGTVGVQHAFGQVSPTPLLPGVRFVPPWSEVERFTPAKSNSRARPTPSRWAPSPRSRWA